MQKLFRRLLFVLRGMCATSAGQKKNPDIGTIRAVRRTAIIACLMAAALLPQTVLPQAASVEPSSAPDPAHALASHALIDALQGGGYTLYFRHTSTDFSKLDGAIRNYDDCNEQRMLSDKGREDARAIGAAMRRLSIPVGEVLASPFCRTVDTAMLMFGRVRKVNEVREGAQENYPALKKLLAKAVTPAGTNRMIAGHGTPFRRIAGAPHLGEGEAAVLRPLGDRYIVVARIAPADWAALKAINSGSNRR